MDSWSFLFFFLPPPPPGGREAFPPDERKKELGMPMERKRNIGWLKCAAKASSATAGLCFQWKHPELSPFYL